MRLSFPTSTIIAAAVDMCNTGSICEDGVDPVSLFEATIWCPREVVVQERQVAQSRKSLVGHGSTHRLIVIFSMGVTYFAMVESSSIIDEPGEC